MRAACGFFARPRDDRTPIPFCSRSCEEFRPLAALRIATPHQRLTPPGSAACAGRFPTRRDTVKAWRRHKFSRVPASRFRYASILRDAAPWTCNLIEPGELQTGQATTDEGWRYRNLYIGNVVRGLLTTYIVSFDCPVRPLFLLLSMK